MVHTADFPPKEKPHVQRLLAVQKDALGSVLRPSSYGAAQSVLRIFNKLFDE